MNILQPEVVQYTEREKQILSIIEKIAPHNKNITYRSTFTDDLGFDLLDIARLALTFEEEFNCAVSDEQMKSMKTIEDCFHYIDSVLAPDAPLSVHTLFTWCPINHPPPEYEPVLVKVIYDGAECISILTQLRGQWVTDNVIAKMYKGAGITAIDKDLFEVIAWAPLFK